MFNIIWKDFCQNFSFLMDFLKHLPPLPTHLPNSQNLLSITKVFCFCSLRNIAQSWHLNQNLLLNSKSLKYLKKKKVDQKSPLFQTLFVCIGSFTNKLIFWQFHNLMALTNCKTQNAIREHQQKTLSSSTDFGH